jgi:hypothetical protein
MTKNSSGETIAEIIIAITIILLAISAGFKTAGVSFQQKAISEDRVTALNLAREGIEAVRWIRDNNWIQYAQDKRICWNFLEDNNNDGKIGTGGGDDLCEEQGATGQANHIMGTGGAPLGRMEYFLRRNGTYWFLSRGVFSGGVLQNGDFTTKITKATAGVSADGKTEASGVADEYPFSFRLCKETNTSETDFTGLFISCLDEAKKYGNDKSKTTMTKFLRSVRIEYNNPMVAPTKTDNIVNAIVTVQWIEQDLLQKVELMSSFSDHFGRKPQDQNN